MANHAEHVRAGVRAYLVLLLVAFGLWVARGSLPVDGSAYLFPWAPGVAATALGVGVGVVLAVLGALFPDVDIKSKGQILFYRVFVAVDVALILLFYLRNNLRYLEASAFLGLAAAFPLIGKHRGWTHSRLAMLVMPTPLLLVPMALAREVVWTGAPYYAAAVVGYASHLYKDRLLFRLRRT